jgi:3-hydroxybutyryl-CoA dehydrogenase
MTKGENVCIVGPGRMGVGISTAILLCNRGYKIKLIDLKDRGPGKEFDALNRAKREIESNLNLLRDLGELSTSPAKLIEDLELSRDVEKRVTECEFIFEALPERPEFKRNFLARIDPLLDEKTIVASATSTINLETLWEAVSRPGNIITTHWLNPAFIIPLVEISSGQKTSGWVVEKTRGFLNGVGKIPVIMRNSPGFIVPRIQAAAMNEAVRILEEGVSTGEDIDTAIKAGFGFRLAVLGLIEFIDLGGVDILYHAGNYLYSALGQPQFKPPGSVIEKIEKGELGPKTGKGFFDYSGVNTEKMFRNRYRGFLEFLNLVRRSEVLNFRGGIWDDR